MEQSVLNESFAALPGPTGPEELLLLLVPDESNSNQARHALTEAGLRFETCQNIEELCAKALRPGTGAALISHEILTENALAHLREALGSAPAWSDLPLLIWCPGKEGEESVCADHLLNSLGSVTLLEGPLRTRLLVTSVHSALRARRRQFQVRDLLEQQKKGAERVHLLAAVASQLLLSDRPEEILSSVFERIRQRVGLEGYVCFLVEDPNESLGRTVHTSWPQIEGAGPDWLAAHAAFCQHAARTRKPVMAENVAESNDPNTAHFRARGVRVSACFPLVAHERLIGTLSFGSCQRDRLDPEDVALLETVCNQVAVALERTRSEEALSELNQLLEKRVQERTGQLQEINEQMEAFTYSISHDLRAPLRAIRGFAQALDEDYSPVLDDTGRDYLARIGQGAERLDRLVQDLLQYSRLGRLTLTSQPLSVESLLERVLQQLEAMVQPNQATVDVQTPLPWVLGHELTLEQVVANLVSNALKFVAPDTKPHLRIWSEDKGPMVRLWFEDNGIGISPAHHHRIFGVFERLHTPDAYPGTGIGLAIVAKGIARMRGSAGVESELGQGSRFWIELPLAQPVASAPTPAAEPSATDIA